MSTDEFRVAADGRIIRRAKKYYANRDFYDGDFVGTIRHGTGTLMQANGIKYEGEFRNNLFNGYGIQTWPQFEEDGEEFIGRRYEGEFLANLRHGRGVFILGNGDFYTGMFERGHYHGFGTLRCSVGFYEGEWVRGKPSGKMKIKFLNGDEYEGDMLIGYYHGQGRLTYAEEKGYYSGAWVRDLMHGKGERLYANGNFYQGTFFEGQIHGEGKMIFSNQDQYVGDWKRGFFDGKGMILYASGDRYDGEFQNGVFAGEGTYKYKDGSYYSGEYKNMKIASYANVAVPICDGLRHGYGTRVWSDGTKYAGTWKRDKPAGTGTLFLTDGTKYEGEFHEGVRNGVGSQNYGNLIGQRFTCPLGRVHGGHGYCTYKGEWKHGVFWGQGDFLCDDGRLYSGAWVRGQRHGQGKQMLLKKGDEGDKDRMFIGGQHSLYRFKSYSGDWVEDRETGVGKATYVNGDTIEGDFVNGLPHGIVIYKFASTGKRRRARYHNGYRVEWLSEVLKKKLNPFAKRNSTSPSRSPSPGPSKD